MKKRMKRLGALLGALLIIASSALTSLANAVNLNSASVTFTMPDHDVNLVAISEANGYTIVFNGNGNTNSGTTMADLSMTYDQSKVLTTNAYTKVGYTFLGWSTDSSATTATYTDGQEVSNLTSTNGGTVTLYAVWSANTYQVAFNPNPGEDILNEVEGSMSNQDFTYNQSQALTTNGYTRVGYTFLGWSRNLSATGATYTDEESVGNLTATSGDIVTLYAVWSANTGVKYTVNHYYMNTGGTYPDTPTHTYEYLGTTYELVTGVVLHDAGFELVGEEQTARIKGDGSTVINYQYTRDQYDVTLTAGRGIDSVSGAGKYYYNEEVSVDAVLKDGYKDLVWTGTFDAGTFNMPVGDVNMTASATPIDYTITLDLSGGTMSGPTTFTYTVEDVASGLTLEDPTRVGYDFLGWSGTNQSTPKTGLTIPVGTHENLDYEAVWSARSDINYYVHHMDEDILSDTYTQRGETQTLIGSADAPLTLEDLKVDVDGDCVTYEGGSLTESTSGLSDSISTTTILPDGSRHIYLYYTRNVYNVTLTRDENIASVTLNTESNMNMVTKQIKCGASVEIDAEPNTGYHFLHWLDQSTPLLNTNP